MMLGLQVRKGQVMVFITLTRKLSGSSFTFSVKNTSTIYLSLFSTQQDLVLNGYRHISPGRNPDTSPLSPGISSTAPPIELLANIDCGRPRRFTLLGKGLIRLAPNLDPSRSCVIRITLVSSYETSRNVLEFGGIWLKKGGFLDSSGETCCRGVEGKYAASEKIGYGRTDMNTRVYENPRGKRRSIVEVLVSSALLKSTCNSAGHKFSRDEFEQNTTLVNIWPRYVEDQFETASIVTIPLLPDNCVVGSFGKWSTQQLQAVSQLMHPGSAQFQQPQSSGIANNVPVLLILEVEHHNIQAFSESSTNNEGELEISLESFVMSYTNFLRTIRKSVYPVSRDVLSKPDGRFDESFIYNSAPSTISIFLLLPVVPVVPQNRAGLLFLRRALLKVQKELEDTIGDKNTFFIDNSGWLDESDFEICETTNTECKRTPMANFALRKSGHIKLAYHLSLQMCPYLTDTPASEAFTSCPFDRHNSYVGDLYEPVKADFARGVEDRKIRLIKSRFGMPA